MSSATTVAQLLSVSVSLLASGGIATLSLFDIPEIRSQPASRSLPSIRWLFSRGSHIFPQAALLSSAGFAYLAYKSIPPGANSLGNAMHLVTKDTKVMGYLAAAALTFSIAPFTGLMVPTNFKLIEMNEQRGGTRSKESARARKERHGGSLQQQQSHRTALDSVNDKDEGREFTDLSMPQTQTDGETTEEDDEKVRELLDKFAMMNAVRSILLGSGGIVGLWVALTA